MILNIVTWRGAALKKFLQAYTIRDWTKDPLVLPLPTAFVNQQGRVVGTMLVYELSEQTLKAQVLKDNWPTLHQHLQRYALLNRITMTLGEELQISDAIDPNQPMIWISEQHARTYTCHDLSLDTLNWISFDKGCYLGQEIVARMHYLKKVQKKRLVLVPVSALHVEDPILQTDGTSALSVWPLERFSTLESTHYWDGEIDSRNK